MPKIVDTDLIATEAHYHHLCKSAYLLSANRVSQKDTRETKRETPSDTSLLDICAYTEQSVITDNRPERLNSVYERYLDICSASAETRRGSAFSLSRTLMSHFKERIKIQSLLLSAYVYCHLMSLLHFVSIDRLKWFHIFPTVRCFHLWVVIFFSQNRQTGGRWCRRHRLNEYLRIAVLDSQWSTAQFETNLKDVRKLWITFTVPGTGSMSTFSFLSGLIHEMNT